MVSLDLFLFYEFGLTSLTNVQRLNKKYNHIIVDFYLSTFIFHKTFDKPFVFSHLCVKINMLK